MKILYVGWNFIETSGVTTFVKRITDIVLKLGHEVEVIDAKKQSSLISIEKFDVIHLQGLWKLHSHSILAKKIGIPLVWSTHGMTAPWSMRHKWWKKLPAWWLYQKWDLKSADIIHCTTEQEVEWNRRLGFHNCFIAPLGTDEIVANDSNIQNGGQREKILLFVGRIYPVKGLVNLIRAWQIVLARRKPTSEVWRLRIVGPDEAGHLATLLALVSQLGLRKSVEFPGPKFGEELSREYDLCDCLVLPSFTENFGATVIDALAHQKPCIASTFTPWKELQERKCGWWVSNEPSVLAKAITEMMEAGDECRREMGARGVALVREKYTWAAVADKLIRTYQDICLK